MSDTATVTKLPPCDICANGNPAAYDARLPGWGGMWANVCVEHWCEFGPGMLGTGHGQELVVSQD